jgi:hypothetical protein
VNIAARSAKPTWFRLVGVHIGNATVSGGIFGRPVMPIPAGAQAAFAMPLAS